MTWPTEEEMQGYRTQAQAVGGEKIVPLLTERMWCHELENKCAEHFNIDIKVAICLVDLALRQNFITLDGGYVIPIRR